MAPRKEIREQVVAQVIEVIKQARDNGEDDMKAVSRTFPGLPEQVYWQAWSDLEDAELNAWWDTVEKTIDGEIIKNAITGPK